MNPSPNVCMTLPGDFVCGSSFVHVAFVRRYSDNQTMAAQQCAAQDARLRLAPARRSLAANTVDLSDDRAVLLSV